jgi:hypothetical protein
MAPSSSLLVPAGRIGIFAFYVSNPRARFRAQRLSGTARSGGAGRTAIRAMPGGISPAGNAAARGRFAPMPVPRVAYAARTTAFIPFQHWKDAEACHFFGRDRAAARS